jgi:SOS response regulatory protein OraA/RecX
MKKVISIILVACMLLCLCACGKDNDKSSKKDKSSKNLTVYPITTPAKLLNDVEDIPREIFDTLESENGLGGTIYAFEGTVKDLNYVDDVDFEVLLVETKYGDVLVANIYKQIANQGVLAIEEDLYKTPKVNEKVKFVCVYSGYSQTYDLPAFMYGNTEYLVDSCSKNDYDYGSGETSHTHVYSDATCTEPKTCSCGHTIGDALGHSYSNGVCLNCGAYDPSIPQSKRDALAQAQSYLRSSSFSYLELIDQLEYHGYSYEDAVYAVDNCGADWYDQALKMAKSYLKTSSFSYLGLIDQLEYSEFTYEQAKYGADNCGADWYAQAAKSAASYLKYSSFTRAELINQLEYEGFTYDQAVYGVNSVGL